MKRTAWLPAVFIFAAVLVQAQSANEYERRYGAPVEVAISDLVQSGMAYTNRAVRTSGRLEVETGGSSFRLRDTYNYSLIIIPVSEIGQEFVSEARFRSNQELQIT